MRPKIVVGNWKLHGSHAFAQALVAQVAAGLPLPGVSVIILPPLLYLSDLTQRFKGEGLAFGAQNVSHHDKGAYTGEVSAAMVADVGAHYTLVGHSERREYHHEDSELVARKFAAALSAGLRPILCVGESLPQREAGQAEVAIAMQLAPVLALVGPQGVARGLIAYEPVWAIGTGRHADPSQVQAMHAFIRGEIARQDARIGDSLLILYGGGIKPCNAAELFSQQDVDGGLIGGASLVADDFLAIARAAV
ncbi:triose-phosphate isomerase [Xylella fastidiosa subsp. multiplex]|uniref:Triosephosphate isomerase n=1 Tax=Xylella fastidiosa subsp. multiplex TaxID=644357 RepID=A0A9Q4QTF6_XYLFS|nr:triose-phosphate isomerase [Xylella fastidiosa]MBE0268747.1 triose-phosphate isomerase [Xylella fastidiosa subsp. multiplex]MBE0275461.1 triose-phosphate isomerase [Xylella fastidiosa subsp. multiplex]MBE0277612.1 triose-phosphate isomerase [Xylella fastidiosa subsp. multiplex]MBE0281958.1 triose-phosphate isomerase [Xylella fastidiosa subsp. multiplex]MRT53360.1 triose-phosphate isomerase [Xylella fastidiosa subsp. multiplex]